MGPVLRALGTFGSAAREAIPVLRDLLDTECASAAARALWQVEGDVSVVLPVLLRELAAEEAHRRRSAAEALSRLGPAAAPAPSGLRRTAEAGWVWERVTAACALWRMDGGDGGTESVVPVLRAAWTENPHTRGAVAGCLVDMGPARHPCGTCWRRNCPHGGATWH
ncbi:hypothetical protein ABT063_42710 [Streptomyces sp. NPDC002838]|uniref:HEAT repeat domain-containing protein n=1 Tax=Streptomyces sp. NPDC002838 TaxID=3154436 RepID=UPI003327FFE8